MYTNLKINGDNTIYYILFALAGAAVAAMGIYAVNPSKNIKRDAVTPQWPLQYTEINAAYDDNTVNPWMSDKNPYDVTDPQMFYNKQWTTNRGNDIFGTDQSIYEYGVA